MRYSTSTSSIHMLEHLLVWCIIWRKVMKYPRDYSVIDGTNDMKGIQKTQIRVHPTFGIHSKSPKSKKK